MNIFEYNMTQQKFWRRTSESLGSLRFFFVLLFFVVSNTTQAQNSISNPNYYYSETPYTPQLRDYGLEVGSMMMESGLYWLGVNWGLHWGQCLFYKDSACQQYFDLGFGSGGRDGETEYVGLASARFQWVRFPSSWSPFSRVFAGVLNTIYLPRSGQYLTYGLGVGITRRLHEHLDLRFELRTGYGYMLYAQALMGLQLKIDNVISDFTEKIKNWGQGIGNAIKPQFKQSK